MDVQLNDFDDAASATSAAASAVCGYYVVIEGRKAPEYKYKEKYIQQRQQYQKLFCQCVQLYIQLNCVHSN